MVDRRKVPVDVAAQDMARAVPEAFVAGDGRCVPLPRRFRVAVVDEAALEDGFTHAQNAWCTTRSRNGAAETMRCFGSKISIFVYRPGRYRPLLSSRSRRSTSFSRFARNAAAPGFARLPFAARTAAASSAGNDAMASNRSCSFFATLGLRPCAHPAPGVVDTARRMLVAAQVQDAQVPREPEQETEFLKPQVGIGEVTQPAPRIGRLDQAFEHVHGGRLDAVAKQELVAARKALHVGMSHRKNR